MNKRVQKYNIATYLTAITMGVLFAQTAEGQISFYGYHEREGVEIGLNALRGGGDFPHLNDDVEIISARNYGIQNTTHCLLIERPDQAPIDDIRNYSFDCEKGDDTVEMYLERLQTMQESIASILGANPQNRVSVYINPRECVKDEFYQNGIRDAHLNTIEVLKRYEDRGCVLIPAYTFVPAERALDEREHGVNINDTTAMANALLNQNVQYKLILGVHNYEGNGVLFRRTLDRLRQENVVRPEDGLAFYGLQARCQ